jgi:hypothetical protein
VATKTEIRQWMRRARADLRDLELALRADDGEAALTAAEDLSGTGGEVFNLVSYRWADMTWHDNQTS